MLAGNAVLYKPSEYAPRTGLHIARLLHASGVPGDVFVPLIGAGEVGSALLRQPIEALLEARTVEEQREIYESRIRDRLWSGWIRWFLARHSTLSLIGVPWPQRDQIVHGYPGGVAGFVTRADELADKYGDRFTPGPLS